MGMEEILPHINSYATFSKLPGYREVEEGLREREIEIVRKNPYIGDEVVTHLRIPSKLRRRKLSEIRRIASSLYGGYEEIDGSMEGLRVEGIKRIDYANTRPIELRVVLPGELEKRFFVKKFDEKRWFGLELEDILGPFKFPYSASGEGIYEDSIEGFEARDMGDRLFEDPELVGELIKLDVRSGVMLLGDLHESNYLVEFTDERIIVRPIDFDKMFESFAHMSPAGGLLFSEAEFEKAVRVVGRERYESIVRLERDNIRKRVLESGIRTKRLLEVLASSKEANYDLDKCKKLIISHRNTYAPLSGRFPISGIESARNMGELLENHMRNRLNL
ncbi:hypothetical protein D6829_00255 [Candidatus Pacearchaeota archaeon]|nr:MAG: hypothetical protein D6829_00255 [Candidatus Pacearchaeota archaeon]